MSFTPPFVGIDLVLSVIRISGSFFSLPFSFSRPLAVGTVAMFLVGVPWVEWVVSLASLAAERFHGNGLLNTQLRY
jgi:hypothetical protein